MEATVSDAPSMEFERARTVQMETVLRDTAANAASGIAASFLIAALDWQLEDSDHQWRALPWWCLYATFGFLMIRISRRFKRGAGSPEAIRIEIGKMTPLHAGAGIVWGLSSWVMLPTTSILIEVVVIIANAMVLLSVAYSRGNYRPLLFAFVLPAATIYILGILRLADPFHLALGLGFIIFTTAILSFAKIQRRALDAEIQLTLKTETLLSERTAEQRNTELARIDAERARASAEQANRSKTDFLIAIGHDLRQPLHALTQYTGQLADKNVDATLEPSIDGLRKSLDSLQRLIDASLEFSRVSIGTTKVYSSSFELSPIFGRLDAQLRPLAQEKHLQFLVDDGHRAVHSDNVLIERIIRNLAVNAITYTQAGRVVIRARGTAEATSIVVADTGIGIGRNDLPKIFDEFYQIRRSGGERLHGLGLGLAIVRRLASLLDISIAVRSKEGAGTVFRLKVRAARPGGATLAMAAKHRGEPDHVYGATVVLIDDEPENASDTESMLLGFGCSVIRARSGIDAATRSREASNAPQLAICNARLESGTGEQAIDWLMTDQRARHGPELDIACLLIDESSQQEAPTDRSNTTRTGHAVLRRPFSAGELYSAVNERLAGL